MSEIVEQMKGDIRRNIERLTALPEQIEAAYGRTNNKAAIDLARMNLKSRFMELKIEASAEVDQNGKKLYNNEEAREHQASVYSVSDPAYLAAVKELKQLEDEKFRAELLFEKLRNEFQALKIIISATTELLRNETISLAAQSKVVKVEVHHVTV